MLKRMAPPLARRVVAEARAARLSDPAVDYPRWYLRRWHFLPEGYLSRRSAATYESVVRNLYNQAREGRLLRALAGHVSAFRPTDVIELGCGPGRAIEALARALPASSFTGVDLSPFLLERAERRTARFGSRVTLRHSSALHPPFVSGRFDAALAIHFIGHLPQAAARDATIAALTLLRPGGRLYVIDHAWHPHLPDRIPLVLEQRLNAGIVRFSVFERPPGGFAELPSGVLSP
ncbi:MAG TPA: class I SAM-dependent methyltransferase [Tepidiformaceae bacterium]|nr:class I SAM-dependent methyltransferase [Tepidiformaceae bacterium]